MRVAICYDIVTTRTTSVTLYCCWLRGFDWGSIEPMEPPRYGPVFLFWHQLVR